MSAARVQDVVPLYMGTPDGSATRKSSDAHQRSESFCAEYHDEMAPRRPRPQQIGATQAPEFASEELESVQLAGLDARFEPKTFGSVGRPSSRWTLARDTSGGCI